MANAGREFRNSAWLMGAATLTNQTVCPVPLGSAGLWNNSGTIKLRNVDGTDRVVGDTSGLPVFSSLVKSAAPLAACTYANGTAGVGATLTANANGALGTVGGVAITVVGSVLLVTEQVSTFQNGLYEVTQVGTAGLPFILTRLPGFDTAGLMVDGSIVSVQQGTSAGLIYVLDSTVTTVGTSAVTFALSSSGVTESAVRTAAASFSATLAVNAQTLSNSGGIVFTKETAISVAPAISTTADTVGGAVTLAGAAGLGTGNGGALVAKGGVAGVTGAGGAASLVGGIGGATSGTGGAAAVAGGAGTAGNAIGGASSVTGGAGQGSAAGGAVAAAGGAGGATGAGGAASLVGGIGGATSGTGGAVAVTGGAGTNGNANGGALTLNGGAKNGSGADGAVTLGSVAASLALGNSTAIATWASKQAAGAATNTIADPGTGQAIAFTTSGVCMITTAAAETNTLAIPAFVGQRLALMCAVYAVGDRVITSSQRINQANNTIITLGAAGDFIELLGVTVGGALRWQVVANDGAALG